MFLCQWEEPIKNFRARSFLHELSTNFYDLPRNNVIHLLARRLECTNKVYQNRLLEEALPLPLLLLAALQDGTSILTKSRKVLSASRVYVSIRGKTMGTKGRETRELGKRTDKPLTRSLCAIRAWYSKN